MAHADSSVGVLACSCSCCLRHCVQERITHLEQQQRVPAGVPACRQQACLAQPSGSPSRLCRSNSSSAAAAAAGAAERGQQLLTPGAEAQPQACERACRSEEWSSKHSSSGGGGKAWPGASVVALVAADSPLSGANKSSSSGASTPTSCSGGGSGGQVCARSPCCCSLHLLFACHACAGSPAAHSHQRGLVPTCPCAQTCSAVQCCATASAAATRHAQHGRPRRCLLQRAARRQGRGAPAAPDAEDRCAAVMTDARPQARAMRLVCLCSCVQPTSRRASLAARIARGAQGRCGASCRSQRAGTCWPCLCETFG